MVHVCRARTKEKQEKVKTSKDKRDKKSTMVLWETREKRHKREIPKGKCWETVFLIQSKSQPKVRFEQVQVMSLIAEELNADSRDCKWDYTYDDDHLTKNDIAVMITWNVNDDRNI